MKSMRPVMMLAGLGLVGALAVWSTGTAAQTAAPAPAKIGSSLIGKLEGPEFVLDVKAYPKAFKEAPMLDAAVKGLWHEGWHLGQLAALRRGMGLPPMMS